MATSNITKANVLLRPPLAVTVRASKEYDVDAIAWQSGNTIRYTFNGSPDLSVLAVDDTIRVKNAGNAVNNGTFTITAVNDTSDWIEITNPDRSDGTDDEASDSPAVAYDAEVMSRHVADGDALAMLPELKTAGRELSDMSELDDITGIRGVIEYNFEEFHQTDIDEVNSRGDVLEVVTDKGGDNGTGVTFRMVSPDHLRMRPAEGWGSQLRVKKIALGGDLATLLSTLYTLSANAA